MAKVAKNILGLIGDTPIVKLNKLSKGAEVYAKLEMFNPLGSVKDRICLSMIEAAERDGKIKPGDTIVEPTSGNTGIGLAYVCAVKDYKLVLTMPETMTIERRKILAALGAELVIVKKEEGIGMTGAIKRANGLAEKNGWFMPQQFDNPANPEIHRKTTGPEILEQVPDLDAFVSGIGTGGTITGAGEIIKGKKPNVKIFAVEPEGSPILSGGEAGPHKIQGIGAGFVPKVLDTKIFDEVIKVSNEDAAETARELALKEGVFVGISSGAAAFAAKQVAKKLGKGKKVVVILPDTGERYLSTELF